MNQNTNTGIGPAYNVPPPVPFVTPPGEGPNGFMHPELGRAPSSYATSTTAYHPSSFGGESKKEGTQYYNYAPPPPEPQQPANYLYAHGEQPMSGYASNTTPSLHPSSTPSPPPPSMTPMPEYAPWAIPLSVEGTGGSSVAGSSSNPGSPPPLPPPGFFGTEAYPNEKAQFTMASGNDKAQFSGYAPPPPSSTLPGKAGFQPPRIATQTPAPAYSTYSPQ